MRNWEISVSIHALRYHTEIFSHKVHSISTAYPINTPWMALCISHILLTNSSRFHPWLLLSWWPVISVFGRCILHRFSFTFSVSIIKFRNHVNHDLINVVLIGYFLVSHAVGPLQNHTFYGYAKPLKVLWTSFLYWRSQRDFNDRFISKCNRLNYIY